MTTIFEIKQVPADILQSAKKGRGNVIPIDKMKAGQMIEAEENSSNRVRFYNAIKSLRFNKPNCKDWTFTVKKISANTIACIRIT